MSSENQVITDQTTPDQTTPDHGCQHYQRNCQIRCPTCHKWFSCRLCHNDQIVDHELDRFQVSEILCDFCETIQEPNEKCLNPDCHQQFSNHYCSICHLWTNDQIYHCSECGICRKGQNGDFTHCKICATCMKNGHDCRENLLSGTCPICLESLFDSVKGIFVMSCGHPIHHECCMSYLSTDYRCPVCHRSAFDVTGYWKAISEYLTLETLPDPYCNWKSEVACVDCQHQDIVPYHYRFHQCPKCHGYNTKKLRVIPEGQSSE